jgi:hypothetical protein
MGLDVGPASSLNYTLAFALQQCKIKGHDSQCSPKVVGAFRYIDLAASLRAASTVVLTSSRLAEVPGDFGRPLQLGGYLYLPSYRTGEYPA